MRIDQLNPKDLVNVCFTFFAHFDRYPGADECWEFHGTRDAYGYGAIGLDKLGAPKGKAHRIMWCLVHGELDGAVDVLHRCDNPPCCNPAHLYLGTQTENMQDMWSKNRAHVWGATLTPTQVQAIRADWKAHRSKAKIVAAKYGVSPKTIRNILQGKSWSFLGSTSDITAIRATPVECANCGHRWDCSSKRTRCRKCGSLKVVSA